MANTSFDRSVRTVVGSTPKWCWSEDNDDFRDLHPHADPLSIVDDEEEQTFRSFMEMSKRPPNERGTGRWKLTLEKRTIAILPIGSVPKDLVASVERYLKVFFHGLPVEVLESELEIKRTQTRQQLQKNGSTRLALHDPTSSSYYFLNEQSIHGTKHVEVFSMFDALVNCLEPRHYCIVALTNHPLCETWDEEGQEYTDSVLGRACGDRVCVVHVNSNDAVDNNDTDAQQKKALFATVTHECLHCFGFDHCITFRCLMNAQSVQGEDRLFLSPLNLKKWVIGVLGRRDEGEASAYVMARYKAMLDCLHAIPAMEAEIQWLERKLKAVRNAVINGAACARGNSSAKKRKLQDGN